VVVWPMLLAQGRSQLESVVAETLRGWDAGFDRQSDTQFAV
jgi:hypothetical protein